VILAPLQGATKHPETHARGRAVGRCHQHCPPAQAPAQPLTPKSQTPHRAPPRSRPPPGQRAPPRRPPAPTTPPSPRPPPRSRRPRAPAARGAGGLVGGRAGGWVGNWVGGRCRKPPKKHPTPHPRPPTVTHHYINVQHRFGQLPQVDRRLQGGGQAAGELLFRGALRRGCGSVCGVKGGSSLTVLAPNHTTTVRSSTFPIPCKPAVSSNSAIAAACNPTSTALAPTPKTAPASARTCACRPLSLRAKLAKHTSTLSRPVSLKPNLRSPWRGP
jgi:hypothetical protein